MRLLPHTLIALALTTACTRSTSDTADTSGDIVNQPDADGDGTPDDLDAFPDDPTEDTDTDGDGVGDNSDAFPDDSSEDTDSDGDGYGDNAQDAFPDDASEWSDTDADTIGDNADNCINAENTDQADADGDGVGDVCEGDRDSDGVLDDDDVFPDDPNESADADEDGVGDNADVFDDDPTEWDDTDEDTIGDNSDNCVDIANATQDDADEDGEGDACDDDRDGDGIVNDADAFPDDPSESADSDGDGYGDNTDVFPNDETEWADNDGDGYGDNTDAFDDDDTEWADADGDGYGDNEDDAFPDDATEWADADGDTYGDNEDDAFPDDATEWADSDADTIGDNADNCLNDANTDQANLDNDDLGDACDADADGDGVESGPDCDDGDATINPGATEVYYDGIDQDCSGGSDFDADGDGVDSKAETTSGTDCDDTDADNIGCGDAADSAFTGSCKTLLEADPSTPDGDYWFDFDGASGPGDAVELTCEMDGTITVADGDVSVGGGWTALSVCDAKNKLNNEFVEITKAQTFDFDGCIPLVGDGSGGQGYNWVIDFPAGYSEFMLADWASTSWARTNGHTTDIYPSRLVMSDWTVLSQGSGVGDIGFGDYSQPGPVTSYAAHQSGDKGFANTDTPMPYPGELGPYSLGETGTQFTIAWGENGGENEGYQLWTSGLIYLR